MERELDRMKSFFSANKEVFELAKKGRPVEKYEEIEVSNPLHLSCNAMFTAACTIFQFGTSYFGILCEYISVCM